MKKGFTLIELLVVISIIGILASMVAVSVSNATANAQDARLRSDLHQVASLAEVVNHNDGSYADLCTSTSALNSDHDQQGSGLGVLQTDVNGLNSTLTCIDSNSAYCVSVELLSFGGGYFCVDSTGLATTTSVNNCTSGDPDCSE